MKANYADTKKMTAVLLLSLFTWIYAEKVLHTHPGCDKKTVTKIAFTKVAESSCTICDFHLFTDADLQEQTSSSCDFYSVETALFFDVTLHLSPTDYISLRGPPVFS